MPKTAGMHVAVLKKHRNGKTYTSTLLRQSYRDHNNRVQKRTLANLSHLPPHTIPLLRGALAGKQYAEVGDILGDPVRSRHHGAVQAVRMAMNAIGLPRLLARTRCPERELVLAMVAARILRPNSKLATSRWWRNTTLPQEFAIADDTTADDLYAAMDWLSERQEGIQGRLARRWITEGDLVLWDLSSTWYEGSHCPRARFGYSRDGKRGLPQINFGLLCERDGRPVAVSVYPGNITDKETLLPELDRLQRRFGLCRVVMVGDRGMIIKATIAALRERNGVDWITALKSRTVQKLARHGHLDRFQDPEHEQTLFKRLSGRIRDGLAPWNDRIRLLTTVPGIDEVSAWAIFAETGPDLDAFPSAGHLAAWAGLCPGNNESGGKRHSGRAVRGNKSLRSTLAECAQSAARTRGCQFQGYHKSLMVRRGGQAGRDRDRAQDAPGWSWPKMH